MESRNQPQMDKSSNNTQAEKPEQSLLLRLLKGWSQRNPESDTSTTLSQSDEPTEQEPPADVENQEASQLMPETQQIPVEEAMEEALEEVVPDPVDAFFKIDISQDKLEATLYADPPEHGGKELDLEQVKKKLSALGVVFGLQTEALEAREVSSLYQKSFMLAKGQPAVDGVDGYIVDHVERNPELKLVAGADDRVDYKNLNLIANIKQGAPLCTIVKAVPPADGRNIFGGVLHGRPAREAIIPTGSNTTLSEDGLSVLAACDGKIRFEGGKFHVDSILRISGNVDNSIGHINFAGEVIVDGDVCEGYTVRSNKNVQVKGSVEGASISAGGDIVLSKGMNGMNKGLLVAGGDIRCKFLENCTAKAGGSVFAESILNSQVQADKSIIVKGKRGVIVGGTYTAAVSLEAKAIGAASNIGTQIRLGASPESLNRFNSLLKESQQMTIELESLTKDINYLEKQAQTIKLSPARAEILSTKRKQRVVGRMKSSVIAKQLDELRVKIDDVQNAQVLCMQIFPPTKIDMGSASCVIRTVENNCRFYYSDGEILRGSVV